MTVTGRQRKQAVVRKYDLSFPVNCFLRLHGCILKGILTVLYRCTSRRLQATTCNIRMPEPAVTRQRLHHLDTDLLSLVFELLASHGASPEVSLSWLPG